MRNKKLKIAFLVLVILAISAFVFFKIKGKGSNKEITEEISPSIGTIQTFISTTGTVLPKNRPSLSLDEFYRKSGASGCCRRAGRGSLKILERSI